MDTPRPPTDEETLIRHTERMRRLARGLVADFDRAEDVVQETALLALTGRVKPKTTLAACLTGVVRNVARKLTRAERRRLAHETGAARDPREPSAADLLVRLDEQRRVLDAVRRLQEPTRSTILLRYIDGLPPRRIAARLGVPLETVKSRLKRGLAALRHTLDEGPGRGRRAWLQALLPVAGWGHLLAVPAAPTITKMGGLMAQTTSRKITLSLAALLLGGVAAWFATDGFGLGGEADVTSEGRAARATEATGLSEAGLESRGEPAAAKTSSSEASGTSTTNAATDEAAKRAAGAAVTHGARRPSTVPPVRHSPFAPPKPRKGKPGIRVGPGQRSGWGGPTGHWTRFPLAPPPKGTARLVVKVTDEGGLPIEDAKVYIGPEDVAGQEAVSYGELRTLGTTKADGTYEHRELTPGTVVVCANVGAVLTGRFGLDTRPGVVVTLKNGASVEADVTLPISVKSLGTIAGRVTDEEGAPLRSVTVAVGNNVVRTDRGGRYKLLRVPVGVQRVSYSLWAWTPVRDEVEVRAADTVTHDMKMERKEKGDVTIGGTVVGPGGEAIAGCAVYLNGNHATLRSTRTDKAGRFEMRALPERVTHEKVTVQGSGIPRYGSARVPFEEGIPDGTDVRIEIKKRFVKVAFHLVDATTGEPVRRARVTAEREGAAEERPGTLWYRTKSERHEGILQPGRYHVTVDALDHKGVAIDLDIPSEDAFEHEVELVRVAPDSVDVHLTIDLFAGPGEDPVAKAKIVILDEGRQELSRFEGRRAEGRYLLPAPSGKRILRITSEGYEPFEEALDLSPSALDVTHEVHLRAK